MDAPEPPPRAGWLAAGVARMPTGAKVFMILVGSLLPFALIGLFVTFQNMRAGDEDARARLRVAAEESAGIIANVLANHVAELREGVAALERDRHDAPSCTRVAGAFAAQADEGTRFAILDRPGGKLLCGQRFTVTGAPVLQPGQVLALVLDNGLAVWVAGQSGATAIAFYPSGALYTLARPSGFIPEYGSELAKEDDRLTLRAMRGTGPLDRRETINADLGIDALTLRMSMPAAPFTSPLIVTTVLVILMWIAAAGISWLVVDRLLIRPLRRLRRDVGNYRPGEVMEVSRFGAMPAQEIRELGETFSQISRTVQDHEAGLAEGLGRQTRLTREVHHRVKNNLQVIASLINFHARGASSGEATEAYASIQRRVDALAVVHRHHYAELEENRGLELRSIIGELAANIRATAPERAKGLGIVLEIEPLLVNQDVAVALAFLITEIVELAIGCTPAAQIRIAARQGPEPDRALLRVSSPALTETPELEALVENRYGRVMGGLARQLRSKLHHDPLSGVYEAGFAITGRS